MPDTQGWMRNGSSEIDQNRNGGRTPSEVPAVVGAAELNAVETFPWAPGLRSQPPVRVASLLTSVARHVIRPQRLAKRDTDDVSPSMKLAYSIPLFKASLKLDLATWPLLHQSGP